MNSFTISNMSPFAFRAIIYFCGFGFGFFGLMLMMSACIDRIAWHGVIGLILIIAAFVVPLLSLKLVRTDVKYDGFTVKTDSRLKHRDIILRDVRHISYEFVTSRRSFSDAVHVYIKLDDYATVTLTDTFPKEDSGRLVKGDRSFVPLLLMYDDIAERYPEKVGAGE